MSLVDPERIQRLVQFVRRNPWAPAVLFFVVVPAVAIGIGWVFAAVTAQ